jgi:hypothetical protein
LLSTYVPIFDAECRNCDHSPVVGLVEKGQHGNPDRIRSTNMCGPHFFADRSMVDWDKWNDDVEGTE